MVLSRRDFVRICTGTVAGMGVSSLFHPAIREVLAAPLSATRPPVFWIEGQACTGCSVSLLNNMHPGIAEVLLRIIGLQYHPTLMAAEGAEALSFMLEKSNEYAGRGILIVEGAIPVKEAGRYCVVGERGHHEYTIAEMASIMGQNALVTLAVGTCAAYGGIPAAQGQQTGAIGVGEWFKQQAIATPVINIAGCPPHPDWIVGTLAMLLDAMQRKGSEGGVVMTLAELDEMGRPQVFYPNTHLTCPYLQDYEEGTMTALITEKQGCRFELGCKGPWSGCDSATRKWNGKVNWCIGNALCVGCTQPDFPDGTSPFYSN